MIEHIHPDGEPVPTVAELYEMKQGYAEVVKWTAGSKTEAPKPSVYRITNKGHVYLGEIMKRNAAGSLARGTVAEEAGATVRRLAGTKERGGQRGGKSTWTPS